MTATLLSDAVSVAPALGTPTERIHWLECFTGKERVSEFSEDTDPSGHFESNSSSGHKEYQDRLRAIALRKEGKEKGEIALALGRSAKFVQMWWKKEAKEVPKPAGVHEYLKADFWRDVEIVRGFGSGLGIYDEALHSTDWIDNMADGRAFKDGGSRLKYDKEGKMRANGSQYSRDGLVPGSRPKLDELARKLLVEKSIDDRCLKRPGLLWYPDGAASAIVHRHEAWTALLSFGAPRILTIDNQPVLLRDGDLIVFGTQRHGVPKMCEEGGVFEDYGGRMSVVFFFMPNGKQAEGAQPWKAVVDDTPSRNMVAMQKDAHLGATAELQGLRSGSHATELAQLADLGFDETAAVSALRAAKFDVLKAAEFLLNSGAEAVLPLMGDDTQAVCLVQRDAQRSALYRRLTELEQACGNDSVATGSRPDTRVIAGSLDEADDELTDEALALKLHEEYNSQRNCFEMDQPGADWERAAIMEQLQELDQEENATQGGADLQSQFAYYEEMLDDQDADEWDGRGDLMVRPYRRERLHIEQQEPSSIYSLGCGVLSEKVFYELLSLHSIRVLYDFRVNPERSAVKCFSPGSMTISCKSRGIVYKHVVLGRDSAYGILKHLGEDEGRNTLAELVWHARRKRSAFLGSEANWQNDHRIAIAAALTKAGHHVLHVGVEGSTEEHPPDVQMPDHILGEEARLRLLEKRKQAGELAAKPQKSAVNRSTESVAQRLSQPQQEIDCAAELRKAETQRELCHIQRRLASLQRVSEGSDAKAGLGPKLLNVNKWVKADAVKQQEFLAAGKTKDGKDKVTKTDAASKVATTAPNSSSASSRDPGVISNGAASSAASVGMSGVVQLASSTSGMQDVSDFFVECRGCSVSMPWGALEQFDGSCVSCASRSRELDSPEQPVVHGRGTIESESMQCHASTEACDDQVTSTSAARPSWRAKRSQTRASREA